MKFYKAIEGTDLYERNGDDLIPDDIVVGMSNEERRQIEDVSTEELAAIYNEMDYFDPEIFQALIDMSELKISDEEIAEDRDAVVDIEYELWHTIEKYFKLFRIKTQDGEPDWYTVKTIQDKILSELENAGVNFKKL